MVKKKKKLKHESGGVDMSIEYTVNDKRVYYLDHILWKQES